MNALQAAVDALAAQSTNQGTAIANQLTSITNQLTSLTTTVNAINTPPAVIATGFLFKPAGYSAECDAQNVGDTPVTVKMELLKIDGTLQQNLTQTLAAGHGNGFSLAVGSLANFLWCRFTVTNGSSANLRANLSIIAETTGLTQSLLEAR